MTNRFATMFLAVVLLSGCGVIAAAQDLKIDEAILSHLEFPSPEDRSQKNYLGLGNDKTFKLSDVKAGILIIEIFSMYCPICQAEAPTVNEMHKAISNDPKWKGKVKIIGIGTGNTPFEVNVFRQRYTIPFPLVPDENYLVQKAMSEQIRTPTFIVAKLQPGKKPRLVKVHVGRTGGPVILLKDLP